MATRIGRFGKPAFIALGTFPDGTRQNLVFDWHTPLPPGWEKPNDISFTPTPGLYLIEILGIKRDQLINLISTGGSPVETFGDTGEIMIVEYSGTQQVSFRGLPVDHPIRAGIMLTPL